MSWSNLEEIFDRYRMVDLFLLVVDRDLDSNRRTALDNLEKKARTKCVLLAENAWQELEVWALAAQKGAWKWAEVRNEQHPKEKYFEPFAFNRGLQDEPGRGRRPSASKPQRSTHVSEGFVPRMWHLWRGVFDAQLPRADGTLLVECALADDLRISTDYYPHLRKSSTRATSN